VPVGAFVEFGRFEDERARWPWGVGVGVVTIAVVGGLGLGVGVGRFVGFLGEVVK
jgi:hypothetical protein